ncbi:MAG TPA: right-handed parallel beta-helix repeat-containing protein [Candidatus Cloacimonadota bacterium]|nr:right-handed parallel beta-helix repeat-containing protein [Candidatus Cloacimonadota bacterium]
MRKGFLILMLIVIGVVLQANTILVRQDGLGNYTTIQAGINAATMEDIVLVHPGRYLENIDFDGKRITVTSLILTTGDRSYIDSTIIDGQRTGPCVKVMSGEQSARIVGFSITNGSGMRYFYADEGGGILVGQHSTLSIESCRIFRNETEMGGGLYARQANINLTDTSFFDNLATGGGGAICLEGDEVTFSMDSINRCSIYNNYSAQGADFLAWDLPMTVNVVVDTFTVLTPDRYFAQTQVNFIDDIYLYTFDIQHTFIIPANHDFYVSPDGNDANDGMSPNTPYKTIAWAVHHIASDSLNPKTVYLADGVYSASLNQQKLPVGLKPYINIEGQSQDNTIIDGDNHYPMINVSRDNKNCIIKKLKCMNFSYERSNSAILASFSTNLLLKNMIIENCSSAISPAMSFMRMGICSFEDMIISNNIGNGAMSGIFLNSIEEATLEKCYFYNNQSYIADIFYYHQGAALRIDALNSLLIRNCIFQNNYDNTEFGGAACVLTGYDIGTPLIRIENCLFTNNVSTYSDAHYKGRPIVLSGYGTYDIINCTFADNESPSAAVQICADSVSFYNCIFANNTPYQIFLLRPFEQFVPANHVVLNHCNVQGGINGIYNEHNWGTIYWQEGNIEGDPLFDYANPDKPYELTAGSPCIDTGTTDVPGGLYPYDLNGALRVYGNGVDMGCYEYGSVDNHDETSPIADISNIRIYPNPFRENTKVEFDLPEPNEVTISVYNIRGQKVKSIASGKMSAGPIQVNWNGTDDYNRQVASDIYFCKIDVPGHSYVKKLTRVK